MCCNANPTAATTTAVQEACVACVLQAATSAGEDLKGRHAVNSQADELPSQQAAGQLSLFCAMLKEVLKDLTEATADEHSQQASAAYSLKQYCLTSLSDYCGVGWDLLFC